MCVWNWRAQHEEQQRSVLCRLQFSSLLDWAKMRRHTSKMLRGIAFLLITIRSNCLGESKWIPRFLAGISFAALLRIALVL